MAQRVALLSDIHANLEALSAVLAELQELGVETVYCLGDVIGYGPDPRAVLELARRFDLTIMGNHEEAVLKGPHGFSPHAASALNWTRDQLQSGLAQRLFGSRYIQQIAAYPERVVLNGWHLVHGAPDQPMKYILNTMDAWESFQTLEEQVCFVGHTHHPGTWLDSGLIRFASATSDPAPLEEPGVRRIINVGSVGQPRDGDPRACFVIVEENTYYHCRVKYNVERTVSKIQAIPELGGFLANRLLHGH